MNFDPIADMLTRIRNASMAGRKTVELPYSRFKEKAAQILVKERFLASVAVAGEKPAAKKLVLGLKYQGKEPVLHGIERVSKPGRRFYSRADKIARIRWGFGVTLVSTSAGLMTDKEAKQKNLGGELICRVW